MTELAEFIVPARRVLGPIRAARTQLAAGETWRATVASPRYGVYTLAGRVRSLGTDLHIGGFNLGSETSPPSDLHGLTRVEEPTEDSAEDAEPTEREASTDDEEAGPADDSPVAHGDIVRLLLQYRPDEVVVVSGAALARTEYGHLIVGGWHLGHPAVRAVTVLARASEHELIVPSPLPAIKTE